MRPLIELAYLLLLAVGLFFVRHPYVLACLAAVQLGLWAASRLEFAMLLRLGKRLGVLFLVITATYSFFSVGSRGEDDWIELTGFPDVNRAGLLLALAMCLRVLTLVLASTWVQKSGRPGDFGKALIQVRVPRSLAWSIDATLSMLTAGGGGGRVKEKKREITLAQIRRGDFGFVRDLLRRSFERAQARIAAEHAELPPSKARDLAVITGVSLAAMGLKMMQVMPGLPVAPGHKNVLLVPFFLLAAKLTRTRFGGLWAGVTVGMISFLMGYGRFGILEVTHFALPGLVADLLLPFVHGRGWWRLLQLMTIGAIMGAFRFAANFLVIVLAGADWKMFAAYSPMLVSQVVFGALSGFVSIFLLGAEDLVEERGGPDDGRRGGEKETRADRSEDDRGEEEDRIEHMRPERSGEVAQRGDVKQAS